MGGFKNLGQGFEMETKRIVATQTREILQQKLYKLQFSLLKISSGFHVLENCISYIEWHTATNPAHKKFDHNSHRVIRLKFYVYSVFIFN